MSHSKKSPKMPISYLEMRGMYLKSFRFKIISILGSLLLIVSFQNCNSFEALQAVSPVTSFTAAEKAVTQAVIDQPPKLIQTIPGSTLNESVLIDDDKLVAEAAALSGETIRGLAATDFSFFWKNMSTGDIESESLNLTISNLGPQHSGRYQLYTRYGGQDYLLKDLYIDVQVDNQFQVSAQSLTPPQLQSRILSEDDEQQELVLKVIHPNPGLIRSVRWTRGSTTLTLFNDAKTIILVKSRNESAETVQASVVLEDSSTHNLGVQIGTAPAPAPAPAPTSPAPAPAPTPTYAGCPAGTKTYTAPGFSATFPYPSMYHNQIRYFGNNGVPQFCIKCVNGNVTEIVAVSGYNCPL
jgi:hypothetical protein